MPPIKIDHVVSFSSEDSVHNASNILSTDTSKKWKCQSPGEKQAIVVLQLEKASQITAIDIGNEHSAYVEVLVSRSSSTDDFKVLLVTSAFMTPLESRQSQNVNKVRMFTKDQLSKPECEEKWDRVKIVCTQPFNRHVQFGLSFITLHSNISNENATNSQTSIGKFSIRPESPDNLSIGALFAKRKEVKKDEKPTAAAAIRDAASLSVLDNNNSPTCKPKLKNKDPDSTVKKKVTQNDTDSIQKPKNRNREELFYNSDDEGSNDKIDKIMKKKEEEDLKKKQKESEVNEKKRKNFWGEDVESSKADSKNKKNRSSDDIKKKRDKSPINIKKDNNKDIINSQKLPRKKDNVTDSPKTNRNDVEKKDIKRKGKDMLGGSSKAKKVKIMKPFHELLSGVTLVISGIQNPERGVLRTMALAMGAKYKPDWDSSCTHLICAFPNTPKFNQVKGKGKIVKKSWLDTCYSERKRLPWRRFALDKNDLNKDESEDEIYELVDLPSTSNSSNRTASQKNYMGSDDDDCKAEGSDTEERIARILEKNKKEEKRNKESKNTPTKKAESPPKKKVESPQKNKVESAKNKLQTTPQEISDDDATDEESLNVPTHSKNSILTVESQKVKTSITDQIAGSSKAKVEKKHIPVSTGSDDETDEESLNVSVNSKNNQTHAVSPKMQKTIANKLISPKPKTKTCLDISDDDEEPLNNSMISINDGDGTKTPKRSTNSQMDVYTADTDEEAGLISNFSDVRTMDVFHGEKFYVDECFDQNTYKKLIKYIIAYNGTCTDDVTGNVDIIVTTKENSKTLKEINENAKCIDQEWILQTHSTHKLIPIKNYLF